MLCSTVQYTGELVAYTGVYMKFNFYDFESPQYSQYFGENPSFYDSESPQYARIF